MLEPVAAKINEVPFLRRIASAYYSFSAGFLSLATSHSARKDFFVRNSFASDSWFALSSDIDSFTIIKDMAPEQRAKFIKYFSLGFTFSKTIFPFIGESFVFEERDLRSPSFLRLFNSKESLSCKNLLFPLHSSIDIFYSRLFSYFFSFKNKRFVRLDARSAEKIFETMSLYGFDPDESSLSLLSAVREKNFFPKDSCLFRKQICFSAFKQLDSFSKHLLSKAGSAKKEVQLSRKPLSKNLLSLPGFSEVFIPSYFDSQGRYFIIAESDISFNEFSSALDLLSKSSPSTPPVIMSLPSFRAFMRFIGFENGAFLPSMHSSFFSSHNLSVPLPEKKLVESKIFEEALITLSHVLNLSFPKSLLGKSMENTLRHERLSSYVKFFNLVPEEKSVKGSTTMCRRILKLEPR